ncbi:MAG: ABC transporter ATP-binding protein [Ignavibacteria bacterium]|nr:ABC transporter ATP-binding protein [Ignavibacteria bacterium]MBT8383185.1 ABC transporter ATP-binding protein [Ignavibacteria bacterium]MBT8392526.1 ABC transporter ATP-binding protein [Ignavibacteria bacterium]NNJ52467.1 ABC transporter ATP-binding protein [Ignavibacteriaceae bacterium]NNL21732.1 ABC transporter ATP-binding protein [Ignavibacteriaceae bacterium]
MFAIETNSLSKIYSTSFGKKKVNALSDISLKISPGTIFGLLGPNGAGKTTFVKLLLGITYPTFGSGLLLNKPVSNYLVKKKVGYLPENHKYPPYLKGRDVLKFFGRLSGISGKELEVKIGELLNAVKLTEWGNVKVKAYSKGMMQRLGLAQALINDPELIFLDEPTDGVDPIGRKEIRDILIEQKSKSKTILLNSHLLSEVEMITDRVGILNKGKLLREGSVKELTEKKEEYKIKLVETEYNYGKYSDQNTLIAKNSDGSLSVKVNDVTSLNLLVDALRKDNILIKEIELQKSTLEEMFISLINESEKNSL